MDGGWRVISGALRPLGRYDRRVEYGYEELEFILFYFTKFLQDERF